MRTAICLFMGLFVRLSGALAQSPTPAQLVGTWIGESMEVDLNTVVPLPYRMTFRPDSTAQLKLIANGAGSETVVWQVNNRAVRIDTIQFDRAQWRLTGDLLFINGWTPLRFRRLANAPVDSAKARKIMAGQTWQTDSLNYTLYEDGSVCVKQAKTGNITQHYWHLVPVEQSVFLVVKGTHQQETGSTHYPLQLIRVTSNTLTVRGWDGRRWGDFTLTKAANPKPDETCRPVGFQLCNTFMIPTEQKYPYYEYKKGRLGAIRRIVAREFQPVADVKQSGLVRFRFVVNCEGKAGLFEVLTVDENYERCPFDARITDQLRRIVQERITDWEPGKGTGKDNQTVYDTTCLLTFRLKDGRVVAIFP